MSNLFDPNLIRVPLRLSSRDITYGTFSNATFQLPGSGVINVMGYCPVNAMILNEWNEITENNNLLSCRPATSLEQRPSAYPWAITQQTSYYRPFKLVSLVWVWP